MNSDQRVRLEERGFLILQNFLPRAELDALSAVLAESSQQSIAGRRNVLAKYPAVDLLARSEVMRGLAEEHLGRPSFPVRGILFDKSPAANWLVPWHQDLTIAVRERREAPGFGPWSTKAGIVHVQPPVDLLQRMLAIRLHLDDCGPENGPVRVLPGTHRMGRYSAEAIQREQQRQTAVSCLVATGGLLLMKPLLLHASSAATHPSNRRVLHIEYAAEDLPYGLEWNYK